MSCPSFRPLTCSIGIGGGLARLEQRLRTIASELARGFSFDPNRPPYPGIHAFEAEDAAIYFGRDDETRAVIERLDARRVQGGAGFLIIIGASGSGKSSLLKAGVLPQLLRRGRDWVVLPVIRPKRAPLEALAKAIAAQRGRPDEWRIWQQRLGSATGLDHFSELLKDLRSGEARAATILLPVDQFEETFTIASAAERAGFLHLLASALEPARGLPFIVAATGRSDVLEGLLETGELAVFTETYALPPMALDHVPQLIEGPAAVAGLNVEKDLPEVIARDAESPEALPLLAHTLWLLYRRGSEQKKLTLADYRALGDAARSLNPIQNSVWRGAEQAVGGLRPSEAELKALRDAFIPHLVRLRLDDSKRVRQPAQLSELPADSLRLVRALVEARFLSTRSDGAQAMPADRADALVEVTHEALFKAWPLLDDWLTAEQSFLLDLEHLKSAHEIWLQAPEADKRKALLGGLLLSRARQWLVTYPQRFLSRDMAPLRAFVATSAEAEDAEQERRHAQEQRTRRIERRLFLGSIAAAVVFLAAAAFSGWRYRQAGSQLARALTSESQFLSARASTTINSGDAVTGILQSLAALPDTAEGVVRPYVAAAEAPLFVGVQQRREAALLSGHSDVVSKAAFSPDKSRIATASRDKTAKIWDARTGALIVTLSGHTNLVTNVAFSADGNRIVTASADFTARIWETKTGALVATLSGHKSDLNTAVFSSDGMRIVTAAGGEYTFGGDDSTARLWDARTGALIAALAGHTGSVNSATFSPDGSRIVTASYDSTARVWDGKTGAPLLTLTGHKGIVNDAEFSPDGGRVVTAATDGTVRLWDAATGALLFTLSGHRGQVTSARFSPDGKHVVSAAGSVFGWDPKARLWDVETGALIAALTGHTELINTVVFSPDGNYILSASDDNTARLWDGKTGAALATLAGHTGWVWDAEFSPDTMHIVTASADKTARIWNATVSAPLAELVGHKSMVTSASFDPDNSRVVTASFDHTARLWDAKTGAALFTLSGHTDFVDTARLSPDGTRIVTASHDTTARVWEAKTGRALLTLAGHKQFLNGAEFSPDGNRFVTA
jgi:WD40 repeat protein